MRFLFTLVFLLYSILLYSQDVTISGKVVDQLNEPISFANVGLYSSADSSLTIATSTSIDGDFNLQTHAGNYYLVVSFISYESKTFSNLDVSKAIDLGAIKLSDDVQMLDAVIIEGERSQMQLSLDKRVFEVGKDLSNIGGSASDILDNVPSVSVDPDGNIMLRGSGNVRILIDGRPSSLTGINVADAMRQLPANLVERVEIITNPSSRYDAEGEVGIINIILRKQKNTTGSFTINGGYPANYGGSFNLNFRKKRINYFGGYGFNYRSTPGNGSSFQDFIDGDSAFSYRQLSDRLRSGQSHTTRAGIDVTLPRGGVVTASGLARISHATNTTKNIYEDLDSKGDLANKISRFETEIEPRRSLEANLSYRREFNKEGKLLTADAKWIENRETERSNFRQTDESIDSTGYQRSNNVEDERNLLLQADYVHPFGVNGKFEAGAKSTVRTINNDFLVEQQIGDGRWFSLSQLNNNLLYRENIYASYIMLGDQYEKFSWQTGLRSEYSDVDVSLERGENSTHQKYLNFFPSAHLSFDHAKGKTLQLSYSYRLSRPRFRDLAPFSNYSDNRQVRIGNPNLKPEYTHSMEAGYLINTDHVTILTNAYYRYRTGVVERIAMVDSAAVTSTIPVNLSRQNAYGVEVNVTANPFKWWKINGNVNFYRAVTNGIYNGLKLESDTYTMTSRATSQLVLLKNLILQLGIHYRAPRITTQGRDLAIYYADAGLSYNVLSGNGTITLSARDLFNSRIYRTIIDRQDIGYQGRRNFQWRSRQFLVSFSYRLNLKAKDHTGNTNPIEVDDDQG